VQESKSEAELPQRESWFRISNEAGFGGEGMCHDIQFKGERVGIGQPLQGRLEGLTDYYGRLKGRKQSDSTMHAFGSDQSLNRTNGHLTIDDDEVTMKRHQVKASIEIGHW
jgi:hypothetical protein